MATELVVQDQVTLSEAGSSPTFVPADPTGHTFRNTPGAEAAIWIVNGNASPITITVESERPSNFGTFPDKTLTIPALATHVLPLFDARRFTDPGTTLASFTLSATANVEVAAVRPGVYFKES